MNQNTIIQPTRVFNIVGRIQGLIARMKRGAETMPIPRLEFAAQSLIEAEMAYADAVEKLRQSMNVASRTLSDIDYERHRKATGEDESARQLTAVLSDLQKEARALVPASSLFVAGTIVEPSTSN